MRYYISDLHFYHEKLNKHMDCRGFESAEEMNAYMIRKWNEKVTEKDEVVILGDFSYGSGEETNKILRQLKGKKYLIEGNHDKYLKGRRFDASLFEWVKPYAELHDHKKKVILSHYPLLCYNGQYKMDEEGNPRTYMLYGHVHNSFDEVLIKRFQKEMRECRREIRGREGLQPIPCNMINCFCMFSDYTPLSLEEWIVCDSDVLKVKGNEFDG